MKLESQSFSSPGERAGLAFIATAGLASALSTAGILTYIMWIVFTMRVKKSRPVNNGFCDFARSSLGCYLTSLFCCDFCQGAAFVLNYHWAARGAMSEGILCSIQGAVSQLGDLGAAIWSMAIALHTFWLLFLVRKPHRFVAPFVLVVGWLLLIILPIIGPLVIQNPTQGSFYGLSGAWCWVGDNYQTERLAYLYGWIFAALALSIVTYTLIYLRFSSIITFEEDGRVKVNLHHRELKQMNSFSISNDGTGTSGYTASSVPGCFDWAKDTQELEDAISVTGDNSDHLSESSQPLVSNHLRRVARRLMWYPVLYALVVLPASVCRMGVLAGWEPPFGLFVFAGVCFGGSGVTNSILFITTRHSFIRQVMKTKATTQAHVDVAHRMTVRADATEGEQDVELDQIKLDNGSVPETATASIKYYQTVDSPPHPGGKSQVSIMDDADPDNTYAQEEDRADVTVLGKVGTTSNC